MLYSFIACSETWIFSLDIKSGFHHIHTFPPNEEFLGFSWPRDGVVSFYKFTVLPFSISTGPYIVTKVLRPLISYFRSFIRSQDPGNGTCLL